jgi:hypothetical protein
MPFNPAVRTVGSLGAMREVLDHAATVDDALEILQAMNIDMSGGPALHYLIADRGGNAALVEFHNGQMIVETRGEPWHVATNYLRCTIPGDAAGRCDRYDHLQAILAEQAGRVTIEEAFALLSEVAQPGWTQWSTVYDLTHRTVTVRMGDGAAAPYRFLLEPEEANAVGHNEEEREEPT